MPSDDLRPPAMTDVARLAGVSHMTVSRVLNDAASVRPPTRARVLAAIDQLGYRRNLTARALVTGRTQTLGVVTLNSTLYGPASTLHAIEQAAADADYFVTVVSLRSIDRGSVHDAVERLVSQGVDGIIAITPLVSAGQALQGLTRARPIVAVEGDPHVDVAVVSVDQEMGARLATRHLLDAGHQTVWHVAGPDDWLEARGRIAGWRETLTRAGAQIMPPITGDWSAHSGYEAGQMLARIPEATAVFVANDQMALGLLRALREAGRAVPDDVSVVGFDDVPEATYFAPPLTTIRQDFGAVGRESLSLLLGQLAAAATSVERITVPVELVERASTTAWAGGRKPARPRTPAKAY